MAERAHPFFDLHTHGFVRVATCTPRVRPADVGGNTDSILKEAHHAHEAGVDLAVYPELCVTGYAIDDLHLQDAVIAAAEDAIGRIVEESAGLTTVLVIGAPVRRGARLYNCALAIADGRLLGVVPKSYLPNYREFYEKRQFTHGRNCHGLDVTLAGHEAPFGTDVIFAADNLPGFTFGMEICEDFWAPQPPGMMAAMAGANILCNLSASPVTIGRATDRHSHCQSSSSRAMCAYAYSASGHGESTTDLAWDGQGVIYELGALVKESVRFDLTAELCAIDIDTARIVADRTRNGTFHDASEAAGRPEDWYRRVAFTHNHQSVTGDLMRPVRRFPFVPADPKTLDEDCYEAVNIQVDALMRRIEATGAKALVLGISGGLDSTHALLVACIACDRLGLPRTTIRGYTMPGFGTSDRTRDNAVKLMEAAGIIAETIDIVPAAERMLADIGHPYADGEKVYDTTFENVQAGLRTDYLFRLAGHHNGFVIGTGDLSEMALGWCTYGVGDQMSHYGVNAGVPKTLIQYLMRWMIATDQFSPDLNTVLEDVLGTEISPELIPADEGGAIQSTEDQIGPYGLHDFFLHHIARYGLAPSHVAFLAWSAWKDADAGDWPIGFPEDAKRAYSLAEVRHWLAVFCRRFFGFSQFKRSAMPNGPKVSMGGALSPRGDWRAPSDAVADVWLAEIEANIPED
ncbi:NAD(+) synthase [Alteriqipengyuania sp. 357]